MSDPTPQEPDRTRPDDGDPLAVTPERMREMARATVELLAEDKAGLRARPVVRRASPEELTERIGGAPPERGRPFEQVLEELRVNVLPFGSRVGHPAYLVRGVDRVSGGTMSAGDFFGELAALDWGAGYGYTRLATVVATSPARLVVVPPDVFNRLVREVPDFERRIGEAVRERLPRS